MTIRRIVVSGGPGAGKSTFWRAAAQQYPERVLAVPEVATLMFANIFPAVANPEERRAAQLAIYHVQERLEEVYAGRLGAGQVLLCDRGTPDGGGYWPDGPEAFFGELGRSWQAELGRYQAVLFLESAAVGGIDIAPNNPVRNESSAAAALLDQRLRAIWSPHPNFHHVAHELDFALKLARAAAALERILRAFG
jgi:predicted ATPase